MSNRRLALCTLICTAALSAQGGPPTFVPKPGAMVRLTAENIPALLAQLPQTAAGRLLAEPEVASAFATGLARYRQMAARRTAVIAAARQREIDSASASGQEVLNHLDVRDLQRCELLALLAGEQAQPLTVLIVGVLPKAEGRLLRPFEDLAAGIGRRKDVKEIANGKVGGIPAHVFEPAAGEDEQNRMFEPRGLWLAHLPGVFVGGDGSPSDCGDVGAPPLRGPAGLALTLDLKAYLDMFTRLGAARIPAEFTALGFDKLLHLQWRMGFAGERILDELELEFSDAPGGLLGALVGGKAKLPPQPMPAGALVQLRAAVDPAVLLEALSTASGGALTVPEAIQKDALAAFDGGLAFGVAAPAGGVIPRLYLSAGIADAAALDRLLALLPRDDTKVKTVTYEGVPCTVLSFAGQPQGMQLTYCRVDGVLHAAESPLSMRAFLQARAGGGDAMDVGDAPLPEGTGQLQPGFDLRCDEAAIYRAFHDVWLPLFALSGASRYMGEAFLQRDDMPSPEAVAKHVGKSRGVLRKAGGKFTVQHLGRLGGPEAAALAMTWGPILTASFHRDYTTEQLTREIARQQLEAAWTALAAYKEDKGRWPETLGELFAAAKFADDALLLPGDALAEDVPMPAGTGRKVKSSFRYFPKTLLVNAGAQTPVLLLGIAPMAYGRPALGADGTQQDLWGEDSSKPIDQFGK